MSVGSRNGVLYYNLYNTYLEVSSTYKYFYDLAGEFLESVGKPAESLSLFSLVGRSRSPNANVFRSPFVRRCLTVSRFRWIITSLSL